METYSLEQWFMHCGENTEKVKQYEDTILKFYNKLYDGNQTIIYNKHLSKPIMKEFYKKDISKFKSSIGKIIAKSLLLDIILFLLVSVSIILFSGYKFLNGEIPLEYSDYNKLQLFGVGCKHGIVLGVILGLLTAIIVCSLFVFAKYSTLHNLCKKLANQEKEVIPIVEIILPKYRSSEQMDILSRIYYTNSNITLKQAYDVCDDFLRENKESDITSVLYDVPYKNVVNDNSITPQQAQQNVSEQPQEQSEVEKLKMTNPSLPPDIENKTFSGVDDAEKELNAMIGLDSVKEQITKLKNRLEFYGSADVGGGGNHMVFMGSAGTGKTTVARIITRIMYNLGYIKENKCIEVSGDYLKSPYTGQTGERTSAIVEWAMNGVLFIDEAYLLYEQGDSASQEATGVLLKAMEDHRKDIIIILAGYEEQMTKLLASNEGFNSRIKYKIYFSDYTVDEMYQIFIHFVNHYNGTNVYLLEDNARDLLLQTFELEKKSKSFGNARTVRNAVDSIMDNYADRCVTEGDKSNVIKYQDVLLYYQSRENELQHELRNASATNQVDESIIRLAELKPNIKQGAENPTTAFSQLVGLSSFTDEINLLKSQKEFYGSDFKAQKQNILLIGPNGCGKSSLANVITGYLYEYGYIKENRYLEISAEFFKGSYVGHTAKRAEAIISYASGGVLFIKNIHLLTTNADSFSGEAFSAIINALSTENNISIIISDIDGSSLSNIQNLFTLIYEFPQYTNNDLLQIFNIQAYKDGLSVQQETFVKLNNHLINKQLTCRDIIQIYNNAKKNHINNFSKGIITDKYVIVPEDLVLNKPKVKLNLTRK